MMAKKQNYQSQKGFTLIELILALAFLTFMLLFVATSLVQLMATYNKGLVYKAINQTGRVMAEEISRTIRISSVAGTNVSAVTSSGRLCTGGKAYIWNVKNSPHTNTYSNPNSGPIVGMVRIDDVSGVYCTDTTRQIPRADATIVVDNTVAIRKLEINSLASGHLLTIKTQLTTQDDTAFLSPAESGGEPFVCKAGKDGEFCASVTLDTAIAVRNTGE